MSVLEGFANFHLELLSKEWVNNVWETDFYDDKELPSEYELQLDDLDFSQLMINLIETIERWNCDESCSSTSRSSQISMASPKTWSVLTEKGADYKALLCLLSVFLKTRKKPSISDLNISLISSRLYFVLLGIPGAHVFNIFNSILYFKSLQIFMDLMSYGCLEKKKGKLICSKKNKPQNVLDNNEMMGHSVLSDHEKDMILNQLNLSLKALSNSLNVLYLKDEQESLEKTIQVLVSLTQLVEGNKNVLDTVHTNNFNECISRKSFLILEQLCSLNHGDIERIMFIIMRNFLPTIAIREEDIKMAIKSTVSLNVNLYVFIRRSLQIHEKEAVPAVKALIQQLCVRLPDKTDIRSKALPQIVQLLHLFKYNFFKEFAIWIVSLAHAEQLKYRLSAIELIAKLLNASEITNFAEVNQTRNEESDENESSPDNGFVNYSRGRNVKILTKFLIAAVLSRSLDASAILRSKCLNIFASLVFSNQKVIKEIIEELVEKEDSNPLLNNGSNNAQKSYFDFQKYLSTKAEKMLLPKNPLPTVECILDTVGILTGDQNVFVRKNALFLLLNICLFNEFWLKDNIIQIFTHSCLDFSLMMRKFGVKCITDLLMSYPSKYEVIKAWVKGVLPLITDDDLKCQEKVIESIGNVFLNNLRDYSEERDEFSDLPWRILHLVELLGKTNLFKKVSHHWSKNKLITKTLLKTIESHIGTKHNMKAWFLVVCISKFQDYPEPEYILDYFLKEICNADTPPSENLCTLVLEAVFLNWKGFPEGLQMQVHVTLKHSVTRFKVPLTLISRYIDICYVANKQVTKVWSRRLVQLCEEYLRNNVAPGCSLVVDETLLCRHIHTLGDASQFYPSVHMEILTYLVDLIDPPFMNRGTTLRWKGTASNTVKAVSIVTLGKICLRDHFIARTYAPFIAGVLVDRSAANVKINAMIALTDLCIRFTSVVEDHLGDICVMLRDGDPGVRVNCLNVLTHLLQEDYLKPKGALFFYLLLTLDDPCSTLREMTESYFSNILLKRNPSVMSHFFIQAIFFFNDYEGPGSFNKETMSEKERRIFSMTGIANFKYRCNIYKYMLRNMRDDHRFKLSNRICADILDEVIDGNIPLQGVGSAVLKDALFSLACEEMRLENMRKVADVSSEKELEDAMVPEHYGEEAVLGFAKKVFISQIVKTNYVEYIVPTISKLKRILAEKKSPLVRDLMKCLRELMKDFREEINDILHSDPELAAEVSWDLKNLRREEEPQSELSGQFNMKELRVRCERLSAKALSEKMGISVSSIKSLQSPGNATSNHADNDFLCHSKLPPAQNQSSKLSHEKSRRSRRNTRLRSRKSVQKSNLGGSSSEHGNYSTCSKSSPGTIAEGVGEIVFPGPSCSSFRQTFDFEKSSAEVSWRPSFHSSPNAEKRSSKARTSLDSESSTSSIKSSSSSSSSGSPGSGSSCHLKKNQNQGNDTAPNAEKRSSEARTSLDSECSTSSIKSSSSSGSSGSGSSSHLKTNQNQGNDTAKSENQLQVAGPAQTKRSDQKNVPPKVTKQKKRTKGKRK